MKFLNYTIVCFLLILSLGSCLVSRKSNMDFIDKASLYEDADLVAINIPKILLRPTIIKALDKDEDSEQVKALVKKVKKVRILTLTNSGEQAMKSFKDYSKKNNLEEWITVKEDGSRVSINAKSEDDKIKNLYIAVQSDKDETVFIDVKGNFTTEDIQNIIKDNK